MFGPKVKFSADLWEKITLAAKIKSCASPEELVEQLVAVEVDRILQSAGKKAPTEAEVEDIANRLKGLGYLD
jgi:hypothetical protein